MAQTVERRISEGVSSDALNREKNQGLGKISRAITYPFVLYSFERRIGDRFPLWVTKAIKGRGRLTSHEKGIIEEVARTDWSKSSLSLSNPSDHDFTAQATALGAVICYGFGNFYAVVAHPHEKSIIHVNRSKGRPDNQVGSVTTIKEQIPNIFDWANVPAEIGRERIMDVINEFYKMGPFGFRGPATEGTSALLTSRDGDKITTQIIASGYDCPSNALLRKTLELTGEKYIFITSANLSHNVTGSNEEPAHYKMSGIQEDFGKKPGYIMVSHPDEEVARQNYEGYMPMSTSILSFHKMTFNEDGLPSLYLERHGSMHATRVAQVLAKYGLGLILGAKAQFRLPFRSY